MENVRVGNKFLSIALTLIMITVTVMVTALSFPALLSPKAHAANGSLEDFPITSVQVGDFSVSNVGATEDNLATLHWKWDVDGETPILLLDDYVGGAIVINSDNPEFVVAIEARGSVQVAGIQTTGSLKITGPGFMFGILSVNSGSNIAIQGYRIEIVDGNTRTYPTGTTEDISTTGGAGSFVHSDGYLNGLDKEGDPIPSDALLNSYFVGESSHTLGADTNIVCEVMYRYGSFEDGGYLKVDGVKLNADQFTAAPSGVDDVYTQFTFPAAYLNTLPVGSHGVKIVFGDNNIVDTVFTIVSNEDTSITITTPKSAFVGDSTHKLGSDTSIVFEVQKALSAFTTGGSVKVDGAAIGTDHYTATEGSTVITFKATYLNALAEGAHAFSVIFADGVTADSSFTIIAATDNSLNAYFVGGDTYENESDTNLVFKIEKDYKDFIAGSGGRVFVDDKEIFSPQDYTHKEGSTVITFTVSFLNTLSVNTHSFRVIYPDSTTVNSTFEKTETIDPPVDPPADPPDPDDPADPDDSDDPGDDSDDPGDDPEDADDPEDNSGADSGVPTVLASSPTVTGSGSDPAVTKKAVANTATSIPKTADARDVIPWSVLAVLAALGFALTLMWRKRPQVREWPCRHAPSGTQKKRSGYRWKEVF